MHNIAIFPTTGARRPVAAISSRTGLLALLALLVSMLGGCASQPKPEPLPVLPFPSPPEEPRFFFERTIWSTGDVKSKTEDELLREILTGESSRRGSAFAKPFDVAVSKGKVYVSDTVARIVHVLDYPAGKASAIGDRGGDGALYKPMGLAVDQAGNCGSAATFSIWEIGRASCRERV